MATNIIQIDKSGSDIFEKDYSIMVVVDKRHIYGINLPQSVKDDLNHHFKAGELNIDSNGKMSSKNVKNRFRLRFHTAIVIKLVERAIFDLGSVDGVNLQICNDFPGHFHEIKDMILNHISRLVPELSKEDIISAKFHKPSLIDEAGKNFREKNTAKTKYYSTIKLNSSELFEIIRR